MLCRDFRRCILDHAGHTPTVCDEEKESEQFCLLHCIEEFDRLDTYVFLKEQAEGFSQL